ncbi:peptidylprolyl isomerase [Dokdonia sp. Hel_I_53]|uniref:peptidylprolyl isomerase n=1 Tax=Dokdonia sp. Hel_I_53 TaxID=1566287 RepID=UPI001199E08C|nr:peptidylprolyl isomerase [Dokdonia sp. Hel_I_53]TVZ51560.1 peptidylprolyl isomerase [Dokdonia sp. Hel_I_53]
MRISIGLALILLVSTSCQDKKTQEKIIPKSLSVKDTITEKEQEIIELPFGSMGTPNNPTIRDQSELIKFLTDYGLENPERKVRINTRFGDIEVRLFEDTPLHRANFIMLVKNKYFNTTQFHRVSPNFVIQGGNNDTQTTSRNRASFGNYLIPNEASSKHSHVRGAFSSAKYTEQNVSNATAPFEFFIVQPQRGAHHLDGDHTVFGQVTKGMEVVDKINQLEVDGSEWPYENVYMKIELID